MKHLIDAGKTGRSAVGDQTAKADCRKILITGDCILRKGIATIVRGVVPSASIVEASCFSDAASRLRSDQFLAAIFDIDARDPDGPIDFRMLRAEHSRLILAVFSRTGNADVILGYLAAGVNGYILGSASQSESEHAIGTLLERAVYVPPGVLAPGSGRRNQDPAPPALRRKARGVTGRQGAVLRLLMNKCSNKEIARELDLSPHTVKIHVSALLRHFSVQRRMDLALVASSNEQTCCLDPLASLSTPPIDAPGACPAAAHAY
jgi:DNA-binding NarL/FixJ family response regulator